MTALLSTTTLMLLLWMLLLLLQPHQAVPSSISPKALSRLSPLSQQQSRPTAKTTSHKVSRSRPSWIRSPEERNAKLKDFLDFDTVLRDSKKLKNNNVLLEYKTVANDRRVRLFPTDLKYRLLQPVVFSVTTIIIDLTRTMFRLQIWRPSVTLRGIKLSDAILNGTQVYRVLTPIFLHASTRHLSQNMDSLYDFGNVVEKVFGPGRFVMTYLIAGMAGNLLSAVQLPLPSLGASGAVYGMVSACYVFFRRHAWLVKSTGQAMAAFMGLGMVVNLIAGFFKPEIDHWSHLGGAIGGAVMAHLFGPRLYVSDVPIHHKTSWMFARTERVLIDRPICTVPNIFGRRQCLVQAAMKQKRTLESRQSDSKGPGQMNGTERVALALAVRNMMLFVRGQLDNINL